MRPHMEFPAAPLPRMTRIRRALDTTHIPDPRRDLHEKLRAALRGKLHPGARIAITAGSRGIGGFTDLLAGAVDAIKELGGQPFIVPAMGSHGGATAEGQTRILELLHADERTVGAPIRATMETHALGTASNGAVAHVDASAASADGIIVLGRTKTHPESSEGLASGLLKMTTVGLGKQAGAQQAHSHGLWDSVRQVPQITLAKAPVLCGAAIVENAFRQPVAIEVVPPHYDAFLESDQRLLKIAQPHVAKLPFDRLDLLIVDELGKTVSGSGMDLNVIGSYRATGKGPHTPDIHRIVVLSLTKASLGNGLGIGLADFTTRRFLDDYDPGATYINLLTATEPESSTREGPMPLALDSDREAIGVALFSALPKNGAPRICRIRNTAELSEMWISDALCKEAAGTPGITIEEEREMQFNAAGNLW